MNIKKFNLQHKFHMMLLTDNDNKIINNLKVTTLGQLNREKPLSAITREMIQDIMKNRINHLLLMVQHENI